MKRLSSVEQKRGSLISWVDQRMVSVSAMTSF